MIEDMNPGMIPPLPEPPDIMEQAAGAPCTVCGGPVKHMQIRCGVKDRTGEYYEGHYLCVLHAMPPEEALYAIMNHEMPVIDEALIDAQGRMKH